MDDIASRAEYSKTTVYAYFKSKDEIFNHIISEHISLLKTAIEKALHTNPGFPEGYYAVCSTLADFYSSYPVYFESILGEIKLPQSEPDVILMKIYGIGEEINGIIGEYIKTHMDSGRIRLTLPPLQATFTLWSTLSGIVVMAHKKEVYINKAMGISKEKFMQDGFDLLLKPISGGNNDKI